METLLSNRFGLSALNLIGLTLLSIVFIIEYYNNIVFNNTYLLSVDSEPLLEMINYLLRMTLWKIHLATGIILSVVFIITSFLNKQTLLNKYFIFISMIMVTSGVINFTLQVESLHLFHMFSSILACGIFLLNIIVNFNFGDYYDSQI